MGRPCSGPSLSRSPSLFTTFLFTNSVLLNSPLPNQQSDGFPLEFVLQDLKPKFQHSKLRAKALPKLRTNRIMNRRAFLIFTQCCGIRSLSSGIFCSGPSLYYKVLLVWAGPFQNPGLQRLCSQDRSARATSKGRILPGSLCNVLQLKGWIWPADLRGRSGDAAFTSAFRSLLHVLENTKDVLLWGKTILPERPAQESGLCKVFLHVEVAHAGVCRDVCRDDATRAWISIGLVQGLSENATFSRDLLQRRSKNAADLPRLLCKDDSKILAFSAGAILHAKFSRRESAPKLQLQNLPPQSHEAAGLSQGSPLSIVFKCQKIHRCELCCCFFPGNLLDGFELDQGDRKCLKMYKEIILQNFLADEKPLIDKCFSPEKKLSYH